MSGDNLIKLGLLPPEWPNQGDEWTTAPGRPPRTEFPTNMTEREVYNNALLTLSFGEGELLESELDEPMVTDEELPDFYNSRMAVPNAIFGTDTDVTLIPGFKEGRSRSRIRKVCTKSLTADKRTKFEPAVLPLSPGAKPARRAIGCQKTPLHWKGVMDEMHDSLLGADMIEKVPVAEGPGDFLFEVFLVPKPKDPGGPPRFVVDYSPLEHCFDKKPFKQTNPFSIYSPESRL